MKSQQKDGPARPGRKPSRTAEIVTRDISPVAYYKLLLNTFLDRRPPGTRQRIAKGIGKDRSFVSQITNAAYAVRFPARYVRSVCAICDFTAQEERAFIGAYLAAHPDKAADIYGVERKAGGVSRLDIVVPSLVDPARQQQYELFVQRFVRDLADLVAPESGAETPSETPK